MHRVEASAFLYITLLRCCYGWVHPFSATLVSFFPSYHRLKGRQEDYRFSFRFPSTAPSCNTGDCSGPMYSSAMNQHGMKRTSGKWMAMSSSSGRGHGAPRGTMENRVEGRKWIAVCTQPDACDSAERSEDTFRSLQSAISSGCVDLVSIRVSPKAATECIDITLQERLTFLVRRVNKIRQDTGAEFFLVVNDNIQAAIDGGADGVHVKEKDVATIPAVRASLEQAKKENSDATCIVGTSCHSIKTALLANTYRPDYLFVGTCYMTQSHPEKTAVDMLEGPELPGNAKQAILGQSTGRPPIIFAIGGIDATNANEPVKFGADGVAAIRSILCSADPAQLCQAMKKPP